MCERVGRSELGFNADEQLAFRDEHDVRLRPERVDVLLQFCPGPVAVLRSRRAQRASCLSANPKGTGQVPGAQLCRRGTLSPRVATLHRAPK